MPLDVADRFRTDHLDGERVTASFEAPTNWHVIAGAPSCGKTTLVDRLAAVGYRTVPEPARAYLEGELVRGRTIDDLHEHPDSLQRTLADLQESVEKNLVDHEVMVLDSALVSSMAWYRAFGLDPNEILPRCFHHRYATVFVLDPLPLDVDCIRFNDAALVSFLDRWITRDFVALGYDVMRVPVLSPEERLGFVIERLHSRRSPVARPSSPPRVPAGVH